MLTDTQLRNLRPGDRAFKVADRDGLYVAVSPVGTKSFRYDYRLDGKRETLTIGRYDETLPGKGGRSESELAYGISLSLGEARQLLNRARRQVEAGVSPSKTKVKKRTAEVDAETFGGWAKRYFEFKADPKSGKEQLADSTLALRKSVYRRILQEPLGQKRLNEIRPMALALCC